MTTLLKITNISPFATVKQVHDLFATIGPIDDVDVTDDPAFVHAYAFYTRKNLSKLSFFAAKDEQKDLFNLHDFSSFKPQF